MRPAPWKVRPVATVWLDFVTGIGVTDSGARLTPKITGRRKRPVLVDLLDTAHNLSAEPSITPPATPTAARERWARRRTTGPCRPRAWRDPRPARAPFPTRTAERLPF